MGCLLGTDVVSEARKRNGILWFDTVHGPDLHISVLTLGEIRAGIERCRERDPVKAASMERRLHGLRRQFGDRIAPVSDAVAEEWGRLSAIRPLPFADGLLAATARVHGWTLATRNVRDFLGTGVSVVDPFKD
ncbi:type II toxin-antitoxin system VapC family toxin [Herbidospora mongoliensis]|uniref:type II toxin-antitoxin system VapC family toxin n=1 Tax=Herbidospora mongoliensis TaxID=688067 RepID=UPI00082ACD3B|nr:type II toxin-antitoxin system VapC family toxin [Herbidospora mongoliensis]